MQRAADAGALAGAIHLPGNQVLAFGRARRRSRQERLRRRRRRRRRHAQARPRRPAQAHRRHQRGGRDELRQGLLLGRRSLPHERRRRCHRCGLVTCCRCPWAARRTTTAWASCATWSRRRPPLRGRHRLEQPRPPTSARRPVVESVAAPTQLATPARPPTATSRTGGTSTCSVRSPSQRRPSMACRCAALRRAHRRRCLATDCRRHRAQSPGTAAPAGPTPLADRPHRHAATRTSTLECSSAVPETGARTPGPATT